MWHKININKHFKMNINLKDHILKFSFILKEKGNSVLFLK